MPSFATVIQPDNPVDKGATFVQDAAGFFYASNIVPCVWVARQRLAEFLGWCPG
jgi:hypothetical protein